jgi:hypothetical protein
VLIQLLSDLGVEDPGLLLYCLLYVVVGFEVSRSSQASLPLRLKKRSLMLAVLARETEDGIGAHTSSSETTEV